MNSINGRIFFSLYNFYADRNPLFAVRSPLYAVRSPLLAVRSPMLEVRNPILEIPNPLLKERGKANGISLIPYFTVLVIIFIKNLFLLTSNKNDSDINFWFLALTAKIYERARWTWTFKQMTDLSGDVTSPLIQSDKTHVARFGVSKFIKECRSQALYFSVQEHKNSAFC